MIYGRLRAMMDKMHLTNTLKVLALLLFLFIVARLLIPDIMPSQLKPAPITEGFESLGYSNYGNQLTLQEPNNIPKYAGNTCTFKFDGVYRIEALEIMFNNNPNQTTLADAPAPYSSANINKIYIQYEDGHGNMRYIKSSIGGSPPNFANSTDIPISSGQNAAIRLSSITDENNLAVFTSKIVVSIGDINSNIDRYVDSAGNGYISSFAFWGSTRDMLSRADFEALAPSLSLQMFAQSGITYDQNTNSDTITYTTTSDMLLYGINVDYTKTEIATGNTSNPNPQSGSTQLDTTDSPFKLSILYNNGVYAGNNFTINAKYVIRTDANMITMPSAYIIFSQPIIANKLVITIPRIRSLVSRKDFQCVLGRLYGYGATPTQNDIAKYRQSINALMSAANQDTSMDICPSVDTLIMKQNQAQQICDNLEYQDKIKSEKLRLEKNKQYMLKLKQQQEEIDQLNGIIKTLDTKRQSRAQVSDMARVMQYQQQKENAVAIRDVANQRLQSQSGNKLYVDLNVNTQ